MRDAERRRYKSLRKRWSWTSASMPVDAPAIRRGAAARVQLACDRFDVGAALGDDEDAAVERGDTPDEFLNASNRRGAADQFQRAVRSPREAGGSEAGQSNSVCHGSEPFNK